MSLLLLYRPSTVAGAPTEPRQLVHLARLVTYQRRGLLPTYRRPAALVAYRRPAALVAYRRTATYSTTES